MQATVVTAGGKILTANATENSDLFWGIRGAGCNFGVVTEFVLRLHPQRRTVFAGIIAYPAPKISEVVSVLGNSWKTGFSDKEAIFYAQTADPAGNVCVSHSLSSSFSCLIYRSPSLCLLFSGMAPRKKRALTSSLILMSVSMDDTILRHRLNVVIGPVMDTCKEIPFEQVNSIQVSALPLLIRRQTHYFPRIHMLYTAKTTT